MKFSLLDILLLIVPVFLGLIYFFPNADLPSIEWKNFTMGQVAQSLEEGKPCLVVTRPRLGFYYDLILDRFDEPVFRRGIKEERFTPMQFDFGYMETIPPSKLNEFNWLKTRSAIHKEVDVLVVYANGTSDTFYVNERAEVALALSLEYEEVGNTYFWLLLVSVVLLLLRGVYKFTESPIIDSPSKSDPRSDILNPVKSHSIETGS